MKITPTIILIASILVLAPASSRAGVVKGTLKIKGAPADTVQVFVAQGERTLQKGVTDAKGRFRLNVQFEGTCDFCIIHESKTYRTSIQVRKSAVEYNLELAADRRGTLRLVKR